MNKTAFYLQISTLINQADLKLTELNEFMKTKPEGENLNTMYSINENPNTEIHNLLQKAFDLCTKQFNR